MYNLKWEQVLLLIEPSDEYLNIICLLSHEELEGTKRR